MIPRIRPRLRDILRIQQRIHLQNLPILVAQFGQADDFADRYASVADAGPVLLEAGGARDAVVVGDLDHARGRLKRETRGLWVQRPRAA